jgi:hypothetical protein
MYEVRRWLVGAAVYALEIVVYLSVPGTAALTSYRPSALEPRPTLIGWLALAALSLAVAAAVLPLASASAVALRQRQVSRTVAYPAAFGVACLISGAAALYLMLLGDAGGVTHVGHLRADLLAWGLVTAFGVLPFGTHLALTEYERGARALAHLHLGDRPFLLGWLVTSVELVAYVLVPHLPGTGWIGHCWIAWIITPIAGVMVGFVATALGSTPARALTIWVMRRTGVTSWRAGCAIALGAACGQFIVITLLSIVYDGASGPITDVFESFAVFFGLAILPVTVQTRWAALSLIRRTLPPPASFNGAR